MKHVRGLKIVEVVITHPCGFDAGAVAAEWPDAIQRAINTKEIHASNENGRHAFNVHDGCVQSERGDYTVTRILLFALNSPAPFQVAPADDGGGAFASPRTAADHSPQSVCCEGLPA